VAHVPPGWRRIEVVGPPELAEALRRFAQDNGYRTQAEALLDLVHAWPRLKEARARAEEDRRAAAEARAEAERLRAAAEQELAHARAEAARLEAELQAREVKLQAQEQAFLAGHGLGHRAVRFYEELEQRGLGMAEVERVVRLLRAAGLDFDRLLDALQQLGGLRGLLAAVEAAERERAALEAEVQRLREERATLRRISSGRMVADSDADA